VSATPAPTVAVVGSLHFDVMVEAPDRPRRGETVMGTRWFPKCGGKGGNQALAAARMGAATAFVGVTGRDVFGDALAANLAAAGVDTSYLRRTGDFGSGMSVAILDAAGDYGAVIVPGANWTLSETDLDRAGDLLAAAGVLLLQNEVPEPVSLAAARRARRGRALVALNAAPARPLAVGWEGLLDILAVNAIEAEGLGAEPVGDLAGALAAAEALLALAPAVIVTAGAAGVALATRTGRRLAEPGIAVRVASTHGAGDMFMGALGAALARGDGLATAVRHANAAAARLVATPEADRR
jgi:ribokinase